MVKLHLGCGWRNFGSEWIHIDGGDYPHLEYHDIVNLPFSDNSVDLIYASHVLEYFDRQESRDLLQKWYDKLKPGGVLRLAVPDFEEIAHLYVHSCLPLSTFLGPLYGKMQMGNQTIYHKTVYDFKELQMLLKSLNFQNVYVYDWRSTDHAQFDDHSQAYIPHMNKEHGRLISLNIQAVK